MLRSALLSLFILGYVMTSSAVAGSSKPSGKKVPSETIFNEDFDGFFRTSEASTLHNLDLASIVFNEGIDSTKALKVYYQGNERGSKRVIKTMHLSHAMSSATLSFAVKFCEGFDFARGVSCMGLRQKTP